jgi:hypothetical protein
MTAVPEQRHRYKGDPPRPWVRIRLVGVNGSAQERDLVVDTGNPFPLIIDAMTMHSIGRGQSSSLETNYGALNGRSVRVVVPELDPEFDAIGYLSDAIVAAVRTSHPDFQGMVGLPLLRMMEYGGDSDGFWIRPANGTS